MHVHSMERFGTNPLSQSSTSCLSEDSQDGNILMSGVNSLEEKKLKRRQKNRAAAQRSRQKHTEKADELHQQHEKLEQDNTALKKEIETLKEELKYWTQMLKNHESTCPDMLTPSLPTQTPILHWLAEELNQGIQ
ncbi:basic leucine zipper transcriptional factor ATF-like 2 [Chelonia mydas]|uniref:Basic leucine zipper transcriptional factor ATF-like 2 n=1 Tax=Chelonia mydas TaxID=8469 RepID=M7B189_CHEMY|nr:basic leucine zipper transcriptional factor ATF-like 2 [Chelonia mydas]EMP25818.1 Basic leucine zipper transcriptional factor ATF-like 2 [Chelonia mydas]